MICNNGSGPNPSVTLTTGSRVLVIVTAQISANGRHGSGGSVSFSLNGNTPDADDAVTFVSDGHSRGSGGVDQASTDTYVELAPGVNTFTLQYELIGWGGQAMFSNRTITVIPLN